MRDKKVVGYATKWRIEGHQVHFHIFITDFNSDGENMSAKVSLPIEDNVLRLMGFNPVTLV